MNVDGLVGFLVGLGLRVTVEVVIEGVVIVVEVETSGIFAVVSTSVTVLFDSPDTVWNVDSFKGTSVTETSTLSCGTSVDFSCVLSTTVVNVSSLTLLSIVDSSDLVSKAIASVVTTGFSVGFLNGKSESGITGFWILSSVCGWTKFAPSIELSSIWFPIIWGRMVLSGI